MPSWTLALTLLNSLLAASFCVTVAESDCHNARPRWFQPSALRPRLPRQAPPAQFLTISFFHLLLSLKSLRRTLTNLYELTVRLIHSMQSCRDEMHLVRAGRVSCEGGIHRNFLHAPRVHKSGEAGLHVAHQCVPLWTLSVLGITPVTFRPSIPRSTMPLDCAFGGGIRGWGNVSPSQDGRSSLAPAG